MGLLDSVIGAIANQGQPSSSGGNADGGSFGGLAGLVGALASNPQLMQLVMSMLSNDGGQGGLGGLVNKFEQAGLGGAISSWIGSGPNQAVSGEEVTSALGSSTVSDIAAQLGVQPGEAADQLSRLLPGLINQLTPEGQAPAQGLGNSGDLMGMLGGLLQQR
jgi:uncharacterized protein YidB (DUF937 family)